MSALQCHKVSIDASARANYNESQMLLSDAINPTTISAPLSLDSRLKRRFYSFLHSYCYGSPNIQNVPIWTWFHEKWNVESPKARS